MTQLDAEVAVVGAGVAGLATTYELACAGVDVALVEQFALGHDRGSSHGASRIFRLSYPETEWVRRAQAARDGWRRYESDLGVQLLRTTGSLDVGAYARENQRALEACGATVQEVGLDEAHARWSLDLPDEPVVFQPDAGVIAAARTLEALAGAAAAAGATMHQQRRVDSIEVGEAGVLLHTRGQRVAARAVVVTAGAWAQGLLAPLGIPLDVTPTRETVAYLETPGAEGLPALIFGVRPEAGWQGGVGTYALADGPSRLKVGVHRTGPPTDPDDVGEPDQVVGEWARRFIGDRLPGRDVRELGAETCLYTTTPDEQFVLERRGRVVIGSACSGHGFKFAPLLGGTLARLARDAASG